MPGAEGSPRRRRKWLTHAEVVQLLVRAGSRFSVLVCTADFFRSLPREATPTATAGCVAIEERGLVKLMPRDKQESSGRLGFAPASLSTLGRYREQAAVLHQQHAAGHLEEFEYRACLKAALANAFWSSS